MSETILVALITLCGSLIGNYLANRKSQAIMEYKLEQLEKKVEKHNNTIERTYKLEERMALVEQEVKDLKDAK